MQHIETTPATARTPLPARLKTHAARLAIVAACAALAACGGGSDDDSTTAGTGTGTGTDTGSGSTSASEKAALQAGFAVFEARSTLPVALYKDESAATLQANSDATATYAVSQSKETVTLTGGSRNGLVLNVIYDAQDGTPYFDGYNSVSRSGGNALLVCNSNSTTPSLMLLSNAVTLVKLSELTAGAAKTFKSTEACSDTTSNETVSFAGNGGDITLPSGEKITAAQWAQVNSVNPGVDDTEGYAFLAFKFVSDGQERYGFLERGIDKGENGQASQPYLVINYQQ